MQIYNYTYTVSNTTRTGLFFLTTHHFDFPEGVLYKEFIVQVV